VIGTISGVVWDVDGTLIDSEPLHAEAMVTVAARYGYRLSQEEFDTFLGIGAADAFAHMAARRPFPIDTKTFTDLLSAYFVAHARAKAPPRPGARAAVLALQAAGVTQGCASNSERAVVEVNIANLDVDGAITARVSRDDVCHGKPDPEIYRTACARLGVSPGDALAVEDTATGVAAAKAAGMRVIAWPSAQTAHMDFSAADMCVTRIEMVDWKEYV